MGRVKSPGGAAQCEVEQQGGHGWAVQGVSHKLLIPDPPSCHLPPEEIVLSFFHLRNKIFHISIHLSANKRSSD